MKFKIFMGTDESGWIDKRRTGCHNSPVSYTHLDVYKRQGAYYSEMYGKKCGPPLSERDGAGCGSEAVSADA